MPVHIVLLCTSIHSQKDVTKLVICLKNLVRLEYVDANLLAVEKSERQTQLEALGNRKENVYQSCICNSIIFLIPFPI